MAIPQPGIFALGGRSHLHLEFDLTGDAVDLRPAINRIQESADTVSGVNVVVGFGRTAWAALSPDNVPDDLIEFETITGVDGFEHPAAQHDLWIWLHGGTPDGLFDLARVAKRQPAVPPFIMGILIDRLGLPLEHTVERRRDTVLEMGQVPFAQCGLTPFVGRTEPSSRMEIAHVDLQAA